LTLVQHLHISWLFGLQLDVIHANAGERIIIRLCLGSDFSAGVRGRKKKCDETHPKCQRCTRSGIECGGYAPLDLKNPDSKGVMRRMRPAPVAYSEREGVSARSSRKDSMSLSISPGESSKSAPASSSLNQFKDANGNKNVTGTIANLLSAVVPLSDHLTTQIDISPEVNSYQHTSSQASVSNQSPSNFKHTHWSPVSPLLIDQQLSIPSSSSSSVAPASDLVQHPRSIIHLVQPVSLVSGQISLFQTLFNRTEPKNELPELNQPEPIDPSPQSPDSTDDEGSPASESEDDQDSVAHIMYSTPTLDPNTQNNALPFVLQSCKWTRAREKVLIY
jgi:hypothetical protein